MTQDNLLLFTQKLENSVTLNLFDHSRLTAGDRWYVELKCIAIVPITETLWHETTNKLGLAEKNIPMMEELTHSMKMTRHFVDEKEKPAVQQEMIDQVHSTITSYLAKPSFPEKLLQLELNNLVKQGLLPSNDQETVDQADDEEPVDFSHCFRD